MGPSTVRGAVERWLLEWEIDQGAATVTLTGDLDYLGWYTPDNVSIVLLPSPDPWASYAYVGGYAWGHPHPDLRLRWRGGGMSASGRSRRPTGPPSSSSWFPPRPPSDVWTAWELAREISLWWPDTAGGLIGVDTRDHARDLVGRPDWFLHYKP